MEETFNALEFNTTGSDIQGIGIEAVWESVLPLAHNVFSTIMARKALPLQERQLLPVQMI